MPGTIRRTWSRLVLMLSALLLVVSFGMTTQDGGDGPAGDDAGDGGNQQADAESRRQSGPPVTAVPSFRQANEVAVLTAHGVIDQVMLWSLERRVKSAMEDGADAIVLDIDTFGGQAPATLDICNLIKTTAPSNTVAWVNPKAYSAGTFMALACREIVMSPNAAMGDASPILPGMALPPSERAKAEAPLLREVRDSARRNHYDEQLVQGFVSVGVELWMLENRTTGERIFVDRNEYVNAFGEEPPEQLPELSAPEGAGAAEQQQQQQPLLPWFGSFPFGEEEEKGRELTPEEWEEQIEQGLTLEPSRDPLTAEDANEWQPVGQVLRNDELLTLKPDEAIYYGLAVTKISSDQELAAFFGVTLNELTRYEQNWSESLVRFLISWPVRAILIVIFLLSLFIELAVPGMGVFGATALLAFLLLIGAPYMVGMAQWWEILLVVIGFALLGAELFIIPGTGIAGIAGAGCVLVGIVGTFISGNLTTPTGQDQLLTGVVVTIAALFFGFMGVWFISKHVGSIPLFNRLVLNTAQRSGGDEGEPRPTSLLGAIATPVSAEHAQDEVGVALTDLRPAGKADFDGRTVDVVTPGGYIERGRSVRITNVGRFRIEVEEVE